MTKRSILAVLVIIVVVSLGCGSNPSAHRIDASRGVTWKREYSQVEISSEGPSNWYIDFDKGMEGTWTRKIHKLKLSPGQTFSGIDEYYGFAATCDGTEGTLIVLFDRAKEPKPEKPAQSGDSWVQE